YFREPINEIENYLVELEKEEEQEKVYIIDQIGDKLIDIDDKLKKKVLCKDCEGKKIEKLNDECGNEGIARFIYECKLNSNNNNNEHDIRWIPFNEFGNIEYLAKGGFGEVHKATWFGYKE